VPRLARGAICGPPTEAQPRDAASHADTRERPVPELRAHRLHAARAPPTERPVARARPRLPRRARTFVESAPRLTGRPEHEAEPPARRDATGAELARAAARLEPAAAIGLVVALAHGELDAVALERERLPAARGPEPFVPESA
jgi:hypothetical protein